VLVEYRDLHWFGKYKFYVVQGKGQSKYVVANDKPRNRTIQLHQLIMNANPGFEVDHINRNGLDNRRSNIRIVTHGQNQNNLPKRKGATSRFRGVSWCGPRDEWRVYINYSGLSKNLGGYKCEVEAAHAYDNFIKKNRLSKEMNFG